MVSQGLNILWIGANLAAVYSSDNPPALDLETYTRDTLQDAKTSSAINLASTLHLELLNYEKPKQSLFGAMPEVDASTFMMNGLHIA